MCYRSQIKILGNRTFAFPILRWLKKNKILNWMEKICMALCWVTLLLSVKLTADAIKRYWKYMKRSNNEPMGPRAVQGTPTFCFGLSCYRKMLERTVKGTPIWSLLFLDCTICGRVKTECCRNKRQMWVFRFLVVGCIFFFCFWKGDLNVKIKKDEFLALTSLQDSKAIFFFNFCSFWHI